MKIFDLGAGSACIGLSLALLLEDFLKKAGRSSFSIELNLVESSPVAQKSLKRNLSKVEKQLSQTVIHNYEKSWISFDIETGDLDVLITNPPYLLPDEYEQIDRSVKDWEEQAALIDQRNCQWGPGLAAFQEIFENWVMRGNVPLWFMEASPSCIALLEAHLVSQNLSFEIKKDINQKDRFIFNKSNTLKF